MSKILYRHYMYQGVIEMRGYQVIHANDYYEYNYACADFIKGWELNSSQYKYNSYETDDKILCPAIVEMRSKLF